MKNYLEGDKVYVGVGVLGVQTDTLDATGKVVKTLPFNHITKDMVEQCITGFKGEISQIPPEYSAIKIKGKRASDLVRKGENLNLKPRKVTIYNIELVEYEGSKFKINTSVSGGTYIRSLIRDIGLNLNTVSYMESLIRTKHGMFTVDKSISFDDINIEEIIRFAEET